jgi:hypothetical protein
MKINCFDFEFPYVVIENTFNNEELELIWEELNFLCHPSKLYFPEKTGGTFDSQNNWLKKNKGIFLDDVYQNRDSSNILTVNRKMFDNINEIFLSHNSWFFKNFNCTEDYTLISYYENDDFYKEHIDVSMVTMLTWFYQEPKKFVGGNLIFPEFNHKININNNYTLIFPGMIKHAVEPVNMKEEDIGKKYGRFCMSQFCR